MTKVRNNIVALAAVAMLLGVGCGTTPETRQATSYRTLKSVQIAVDAAMKVYGTAVVTGKISVEKQAEIDAKHATFRNMFRVSAQAARNDLAAIPPADLQKLANELQLLILTIP